MIDKSFKLKRVFDSGNAIDLLVELSEHFGLHRYGIKNCIYLPQVRSNEIVIPNDKKVNYFCIYLQGSDYYFEYKFNLCRAHNCKIWGENTVSYLYELIESFIVRLKESKVDEQLDNINSDFV